jgi:hypothetical protein
LLILASTPRLAGDNIAGALLIKEGRMHTFSHLERWTYIAIQLTVLLVALFLWFAIFSPIAI